MKKYFSIKLRSADILEMLVIIKYNENVLFQLENSIGGREEMENRCKNLVIPCIAQMAVSAGDDTLWKQLNYQILLKTRHSQKQVCHTWYKLKLT